MPGTEEAGAGRILIMRTMCIVLIIQMAPIIQIVLVIQMAPIIQIVLIIQMTPIIQKVLVIQRGQKCYGQNI